VLRLDWRSGAKTRLEGPVPCRLEYRAYKVLQSCNVYRVHGAWEKDTQPSLQPAASYVSSELVASFRPPAQPSIASTLQVMKSYAGT